MTSLKKFTNYSVSILGFTSKGDGNVSQQFVVSTDEDGQYDRVDIVKMFIILADCARVAPYLLEDSSGNERAEANSDRSIDRFRLSPLFFYVLPRGFFLAKEKLLVDYYFSENTLVSFASSKGWINPDQNLRQNYILCLMFILTFSIARQSKTKIKFRSHCQKKSCTKHLRRTFLAFTRVLTLLKKVIN